MKEMVCLFLFYVIKFHIYHILKYILFHFVYKPFSVIF
nr:MAG TPA: hypothetical protein [Crassvirales sp.]